jgi:hypothetical protein
MGCAAIICLADRDPLTVVRQLVVGPTPPAVSDPHARAYYAQMDFADRKVACRHDAALASETQTNQVAVVAPRGTNEVRPFRRTPYIGEALAWPPMRAVVSAWALRYC